MAYPQPIAYADIKIGMPIQVDSTWTYLQVTQTLTGTVTDVTAYALTLNSRQIVPAPGSDTSRTITFQRTGDGVLQPDEPPHGTILLDDTGAAWQATGSAGYLTWFGINGEQFTWAEFFAAHPTYTILVDTQPAPLPAPVSPYPVVIDPVLDIKFGMDIRVTSSSAASIDVLRGIIASVDSNPPTDDAIPDVVYINRFIDGQFYHVRPTDADMTITVEQMQAYTPNPDWGLFPDPEPAIGSVVKSANGVAWQRIADAAANASGDPYVVAGRGLWKPVTQTFINYKTHPPEQASSPMAWRFAYENAAPFTIQSVPPPPPTEYTSTWVATDSRSWIEDGTEYLPGTDAIWQGNVGSHIAHSAFVCNGTAEDGETGKTIATALTGATIKAVYVGVQALTWEQGSGQVAYQKFTGSALATPDTTPANDAISVKQDFASTGWLWTQVQPTWVGTSDTGMYIGPHSWQGPSTHGSFAGATYADTTMRPRIRITYTRTTP